MTKSEAEEPSSASLLRLAASTRLRGGLKGVSYGLLTRKNTCLLVVLTGIVYGGTVVTGVHPPSRMVVVCKVPLDQVSKYRTLA